jgi:hypothetical protein
MHSSYNYSGFVDLYTSLSHQASPRPRADAAKPGGQRVTPEPNGGADQSTGAAYRQRLRLVPR